MSTRRNGNDDGVDAHFSKMASLPFRCVSCEREWPPTVRMGNDECCVACWHTLRPILPPSDEQVTAFNFMLVHPRADVLYLAPRPFCELNATHDAWTRPSNPYDDKLPYEAFRPYAPYCWCPSLSIRNVVVTPVMFRTEARDVAFALREPFVVRADGTVRVCGETEPRANVRFESLVGRFRDK